MKKILIAEDEVNVGRVLKLVLSRENYAVDVVLNGEEALAKINQNPPDLVISDLSMPKVDGAQLCRTIKNSPELAHIKVIICSALDEKVSQEKLNLPADDFLAKPVDCNVLLTKVKNLLG